MLTGGVRRLFQGGFGQTIQEKRLFTGMIADNLSES
jgi:hypothetical protein